ncbi:hypothetical protein P4S72_26700 [Vibrio sp. PP-XX7]
MKKVTAIIDVIQYFFSVVDLADGQQADKLDPLKVKLEEKLNGLI